MVLGRHLTQSCTSRKPKSPHYEGDDDAPANERTRLLSENSDEENYATVATKQARTVTSDATTTTDNAIVNNDHKNARRKTKGLKFKSIFTPQSTLVLAAYAMLALHSMGFDSLFPVFLHHPEQDMHDNPDVDLPFKFTSGFGLGMNSPSLTPFRMILSLSLSSFDTD